MYHQYEWIFVIVLPNFIEVKIERKRFYIILGTAVVTLPLVLFIITSMINRTDEEKPVVTDVTLCDMDASGLCIVTFGANTLDRMVINFQLPEANYPVFYVKASNRGSVNVYSCEVVEAETTIAYCTGNRTPLGESIDVEVYTTDGDVLIARGEFIVSAILLPSPLSLTATPGSRTKTPTPAPSRTKTITPTQTKSTSTPQEVRP